MLLGQAFQVLVRVLDHDDGRVHHGPDGDGDATQAHQVGVHAQQAHGDEGDQHTHGQHQDSHEGRANVHQKDHADQGNDQALFQQGTLERIDGPVNQVGSVVHRLDADARREARRDLGDLFLEVVNHLQRVLAVARHGDARDHLALAVEFRQAPALVRRQFHAGDVAHQHRRALVGLDHQVLDVRHAAQVALAAHHVLGLGHLHHAAAHVAVGVAHHLRHLGQWNAVGAQLHRVDGDLVGLHKPANGCHLGHAMGLGELVAQVPVLQRAQLGQGLVLGQQRVLVDPAHAGRVRADLRRHALGHAPRCEVEVFEHPRAGPVDVGAILEDDIDEGGAEEGEAAHHLRLGHREHGRGERVGDLVLDHLRRLAGHFGIDDHLHVGKIGQRVERRFQQRIDAAEDGGQRAEQHQEAILRRPVDQGREHLSSSCRSW